VLILFLTATAMFVTVPYALERHPFDDVPRQRFPLSYTFPEPTSFV
jgi:hypothetical protein